MKVAFPEVNPKPNPNIMTDRLTRYYVPNKITEESKLIRFDFVVYLHFPKFHAFRI